mmetsp:Transcript_78778/g.148634  ORF Transcript_78778/g.148634 Transcript_78778/m.148634 type:complete len:947 (-) Transcript_78778:129-2969(-)
MSHPLVFVIAAIAPALTTASLIRAPGLGFQILGREQLSFMQEWRAREEHGHGSSPDAKNLEEYCKGEEEPEFVENQPVMSNWKGYGTHYPGVIHSKNSDGTVDIMYDDGWLEQRVPESNIKPISNGNQQQRKKRDDAVCELAEDVAEVKDDLKDANKNVAVYLASKRAAATGTVAAPESLEDVDAAGAASAPAAAEAAAPSPASMADMDGEQADYLQQLKDELEEVEDAISQEQAMIESNEQAIQGLAAQQESHGTSHTKTVDDLIAEYIARIEDRKDLLTKLREKRHKQEVQLAGMGKSTVSLEAIQDNIKDMDTDMEEIKAKRDKLKKENRLDDELRAAVDSVIRHGGKLDKKVDKLVRAKEEAAMAELEAKEAARVADAMAVAAKADAAKAEAKAREEEKAEEAGEAESERSEADEEVAREVAAKNEAAAKEAEERKEAAEKKAKEKEAELFKAGEEVEEELKEVEKEAETLDTGVHPHGDKWWRYRYEHSYVESGLMIFVCVLMLFYVKMLNWLRKEVYERSGMRTGTGTMYTRWLEFTSLQMLACLVVFLTVWLLDHCGLFHFLVIYLRGNKSMRLPVHGKQYRQVAFDICVVIIFTCLFYFVLMYSIVHWNFIKLRKWARSDTESTFYGREDSGHPSLQPSLFSGSSSLNLNPSQIVGERSMHAVKRSMTFFGSEDEFKERKEYFVTHIRGYKKVEKKLKEIDASNANLTSDEILERFPFFKYLRANVRAVTDDLLELQSNLWLAIIATFIVLCALHYFLHVGYLRVMAFFLLMQMSTLGACMFLVHRVNSTVESEMASSLMTGEESETLERLRRDSTGVQDKTSVKASLIKNLVIDLLQYTMFFLCYGASRSICQPWMWKLHFWVVAGVTMFTAVLAAIFMTVFAPFMSAFAASMAMPPYVDTDNVAQMEEVMIQMLDELSKDTDSKDFIAVSRRMTLA